MVIPVISVQGVSVGVVGVVSVVAVGVPNPHICKPILFNVFACSAAVELRNHGCFSK